jgi:hypothetical protein
MRRRLRKFLPIVLIALLVQILAPVAACWAAGARISDPLSAAPICHDDAALGGAQGDQTGWSHAHDGCCSICSVAHTGAPIDPPQVALAAPYGEPARVVWSDQILDLLGSRTGFHAQARAPPLLT